MLNKKQTILNIIMVLLIGLIILSGTMISANLKSDSIAVSDTETAEPKDVSENMTKSDSDVKSQTAETKVSDNEHPTQNTPKEKDEKDVADSESESTEEKSVVKDDEKKSTVSLSINCSSILDNMDKLTPQKAAFVPSSGVIFSESLDFIEGESAFALLKRGCESRGIQLEYAYTPVYGSYYIEGINNIYEFDCGKESGWMYKVNGTFPGYGVDGYILKENDSVEFIYTCNGYGGDIGSIEVENLYAEAPQQSVGFRNTYNNLAVVDAKTPKKNAGLLWNKNFGTGWSDAPGEPIIVGDYLYVMVKNSLKKLDMKTGEVVSEAELSDASSFSYTPVTYADGLFFCPLSNGKIEVITESEFTPVWTYEDALGGQCLTPITYSEGRIYTGFWNGEDATANYICLDSGGNLVWSLEKKGGFYWAGATVVGDYVVFGSDDGYFGSENDSTLFCVNKVTGEIACETTLFGMGDVRSCVVYSEGYLYFTTKGGFICRADLNIDTGEITDLKYENLGGQSTSTPIIYKDRIYFGNLSLGFVCSDAKSLRTLYNVPLPGYPQGSFLLSTYYEKTSGLYFYCTYNKEPGGLYGIVTTADADSSKKAEGFEIFNPGEFSGYCLSSPIASDDGIIIYKNDSGNIFALKKEDKILPDKQEQDVPDTTKVSEDVNSQDISADEETRSYEDEKKSYEDEKKSYEDEKKSYVDEKESYEDKINSFENDTIEAESKDKPNIYPWVALMSVSSVGLVGVIALKRKFG